MNKLIKLDVVPFSADLGLLVLRVWLGLSMLLIHGKGKLMNSEATLGFFQSQLGIPNYLGWGAILAETLFSLLLVLGFATRWSAGFLAVTMTVAFTMKHQLILEQGNPNSGELAFIYLAGFVTLLIAGAGRYSVDAKLGTK